MLLTSKVSTTFPCNFNLQLINSRKSLVWRRYRKGFESRGRCAQSLRFRFRGDCFSSISSAIHVTAQHIASAPQRPGEVLQDPKGTATAKSSMLCNEALKPKLGLLQQANNYLLAFWRHLSFTSLQQENCCILLNKQRAFSRALVFMSWFGIWKGFCFQLAALRIADGLHSI